MATLPDREGLLLEDISTVCGLPRANRMRLRWWASNCLLIRGYERLNQAMGHPGDFPGGFDDLEMKLS
jgi:hypothetical protein